MESGYYAACAGLIARTNALEVAANNLANINSTGYKAQREYFSSLVADAAANSNPLNRAVNDFGVLGGAKVDLAPGNMDRTANDLDLAIEGGGFFEIQTAHGKRYTRDGSFKLSADRQLQTQSGDPVLSAQGQPIQLPAGKVSISADGTASVDNSVVAKIGMVEFQGATMVPEGAANFIAQGGTTKPATNSSVRQGMLESANLSAVSASVGLISVQRYADMLFRTLVLWRTQSRNSRAILSKPATRWTWPSRAAGSSRYACRTARSPIPAPAPSTPTQPEPWLPQTAIRWSRQSRFLPEQPPSPLAMTGQLP